MKHASLLILGVLAAGVGPASAEPARAGGWEPRVFAESVVGGMRRVNIGVPARDTRASIPVTLVCPDGSQLPELDFPNYGGVLTVPVSVCGDRADATMAVLAVRRAMSRCGAGRVNLYHLTIPPLGQVRSPDAAVTASRGCACPSWPSVPVGLALFGALPFALGYVTVSTLRRRR